MLLQADMLRSNMCDQDSDLICVLCYRDGRNEWVGTVAATRQITPPNGLEEFLCDIHAATCAYDTETQQLIEGKRPERPNRASSI